MSKYPKFISSDNYKNKTRVLIEKKKEVEKTDWLEKLEDVFKDNGFEVEFADEIFESETSLFHYPLTLYKIY